MNFRSFVHPILFTAKATDTSHDASVRNRLGVSMERLSMKLPFALILLVNLVISPWASAQATEPNQTPTAGVPASSPPQSPASSSSSQSPPVVDRPVSWKLLLPNIVNDQERIWSFPARLVQGQTGYPRPPSSQPRLDCLHWTRSKPPIFAAARHIRDSTTFLPVTPRSSARS